MKPINTILILFFILFLLSCKDEQVVEVLSVKTTAAVAAPQGGIELQGYLSAFQKVESHGFMLSTSSTLEYAQFYSLGRPTSSGAFSRLITVDLEPQEYFFRAAIYNGKDWTYGETLSFLYTGDKTAEIKSITPMSGHVEDTVVISGNNFSLYRDQVYFGLVRANVIERSNDIIKCIVPDETVTGGVAVTIQRFGVTSNPASPESFQLYSPQVTALSPVSGRVRDIVTINGDHFDLKDERNLVKFGSATAIVVSSSRTQLKVIVPDDIDTAVSTVTVRAQNKTVSSPVSFSLAPPELSDMPVNGFTLDEITLNGKGFHPMFYKNTVYFGELLAEVVNGTTTQLKVKVPMGPYLKREVNVRVEVLGKKSKDQLFTIEDPWLMVTNTLPFSYYGSTGAFELNGKAHVIAPAKGSTDASSLMWIMNDVDYSWTSHTIPVPMKWSAVSASNGNKAYLYTSTAANNFWEFNSNTNSWTALDNFPGARRDKPGIFTIGEDIYIGWGSDFESYIISGFLDFYRYRPSLGTWERVADITPAFPYQGRTETSTFTIDGYGYIGCGARTTGDNDFWRYDPGENTWSRMADFGPRSYAASFQINGKGYFANGQYADCWEYNPANNTWRSIDDIGHRDRFRGFAFVLNGVPFVGGGDSSYSYGNPVTNEMFRLDISRMK